MAGEDKPNNVVDHPEKENAMKSPKEILKSLESQSKNQQSKIFEAKAKEIMDKKAAANKTLRLLDKELADLTVQYEAGLL